MVLDLILISLYPSYLLSLYSLADGKSIFMSEPLIGFLSFCAAADFFFVQQKRKGDVSFGPQGSFPIPQFSENIYAWKKRMIKWSFIRF